MKILFLYLALVLFLISCNKEEKVYFDNGNIKYINILEKDILHFKRFDRKGNLIFTGKFKNNQLIDTLTIYEDGIKGIEKIDSADNKYFYSTLISKYSTGKITKISLLRYTKNVEIDSVLFSPKLFGKEILYNPNGELAWERIYKIKGKSSDVVFEQIYDENLK